MNIVSKFLAFWILFYIIILFMSALFLGGHPSYVGSLILSLLVSVVITYNTK